MGPAPQSHRLLICLPGVSALSSLFRDHQCLEVLPFVYFTNLAILTILELGVSRTFMKFFFFDEFAICDIKSLVSQVKSF